MPQQLAELGAFSRERGSVPQYELSPTLYLVGPAGRVLWTDAQARMRHDDVAPVLDELQRRIEAALTAPDGSARPPE